MEFDPELRTYSNESERRVREERGASSSGAYRTVWIVGDLAVKVARSEAGIRRNEAEWLRWERHPDAPLAPCYWISETGRVLIQQAVVPLMDVETQLAGNGLDYEKYRAARRKLWTEEVRKVSRELAGLRIGHEDKPASFGRLDGKVVAYDYGDPVEWLSWYGGAFTVSKADAIQVVAS